MQRCDGEKELFSLRRKLSTKASLVHTAETTKAFSRGKFQWGKEGNYNERNVKLGHRSINWIPPTWSGLNFFPTRRLESFMEWKVPWESRNVLRKKDFYLCKSFKVSFRSRFHYMETYLRLWMFITRKRLFLFHQTAKRQSINFVALNAGRKLIFFRRKKNSYQSFLDLRTVKGGGGETNASHMILSTSNIRFSA